MQAKIIIRFGTFFTALVIGLSVNIGTLIISNPFGDTGYKTMDNGILISKDDNKSALVSRNVSLVIFSSDKCVLTMTIF